MLTFVNQASATFNVFASFHKLNPFNRQEFNAETQTNKHFSSFLSTFLSLGGEKAERVHLTAPGPLGVGRVGHVRPRRLLHGLLVQLVFGQGEGPQRAHAQRGRDVHLRQRGLGGRRGPRRGRSAAGEDVWGREGGGVSQAWYHQQVWFRGGSSEWEVR